MRYSYGSFTLHSVLLQQTQMPSFKLIGLEMTKLCYGLNKLSILRANNSTCSSPITPIIELTQDLMALYRLTKFGADWSIIADARV